MAPEKVSECLIGSQVLGELIALPPIWTELVLTIYADGGFDGQLRRFSLFPSVTFFKKSPTGDIYLSTTGYDGRPRLDDWNQRGQGWGSVRNEGYGASFGNPWDIIDPSYGRDNGNLEKLKWRVRGFQVP